MDLVETPLPLRESDRYSTPAEIVDLVIEQWGGIDLDPCSDPDALVPATTRYDIRRGEDGLTLPWPAGARVWLNPPYSRGNLHRWIARAVAHAQAGGQVLALVNVQTDALYWRHKIWPTVAAVCFLSPRVYFRKAGAAKATQHDRPSCLCYFGEDLGGFTQVWSRRGTVCAALALQGSHGTDQRIKN
ncbi:DNA N-6-adenine-methyltransferase [Nannocystis pusilla]|uniref:DNA N-6-adenine-methyltransferase n=1 Tax=Nannocystis pusilla TaxID=889268 RepID=UPI003DA1FF82